MATEVYGLEPGQMMRTDFELRVRDVIAYTIRAEHPLSVYVVDSENVELLVDGEEFRCEAGQQNQRLHRSRFRVRRADTWTVVVWNEGNDFNAVSETIDVL